MNNDHLDNTLENYEKILQRDKELDQDIDIIKKQIEVRMQTCDKTPQILDDATKEFNNLTSIINKNDIPFLVFSILLQCGVKYYIKNLREMSDKELAKKTPFHKNEKSIRQGTMYYASREEIISNPVPFDAIQKEHDNKWYKENEQKRPVLVVSIIVLQP